MGRALQCWAVEARAESLSGVSGVSAELRAAKPVVGHEIPILSLREWDDWCSANECTSAQQKLVTNVY